MSFNYWDHQFFEFFCTLNNHECPCRWIKKAQLTLIHFLNKKYRYIQLFEFDHTYFILISTFQFAILLIIIDQEDLFANNMIIQNDAYRLSPNKKRHYFSSKKSSSVSFATPLHRPCIVLRIYSLCENWSNSAFSYSFNNIKSREFSTFIPNFPRRRPLSHSNLLKLSERLII